jgi:predicted kinase
MTMYVLMAGLPGTGKSTLARELRSRMGGVVLDKDLIRAALFPDGTTDYSAEQNDLCVDAMLRSAAYLAERGTVPFVFLDGRTFSRRAQIDRVLSAAKEAGAEWRVLHLRCADEVAEARLAGSGGRNPARNRNAELYRRLKASFEPIPYPALELNTAADFEGAVARAMAYLAGRET